MKNRIVKILALTCAASLALTAFAGCNGIGGKPNQPGSGTVTSEVPSGSEVTSEITDSSELNSEKPEDSGSDALKGTKEDYLKFINGEVKMFVREDASGLSKGQEYSFDEMVEAVAAENGPAVGYEARADSNSLADGDMLVEVAAGTDFGILPDVALRLDDAVVTDFRAVLDHAERADVDVLADERLRRNDGGVMDAGPALGRRRRDKRRRDREGPVGVLDAYERGSGAVPRPVILHDDGRSLRRGHLRTSDTVLREINLHIPYQSPGSRFRRL